ELSSGIHAGEIRRAPRMVAVGGTLFERIYRGVLCGRACGGSRSRSLRVSDETDRWRPEDSRFHESAGGQAAGYRAAEECFEDSRGKTRLGQACSERRGARDCGVFLVRIIYRMRCGSDCK